MRRIPIAPLLLVSLLSLRAQINYGRIQTDRIANQQTGIITGTAPDASRGNIFKTNHGTATTMANFASGMDSQPITVVCGDGNTIIQASANIIPAGAQNIVCSSIKQSQDFVFISGLGTGIRTVQRTNVSQLANTTLGFSATTSIFGRILTRNITGSTTTGSPINGNILSPRLTEDAARGRTFAFPANFIFTPSFTFNTAALAINELTFKYDGSNWHLISNSSAGGATPLGSAGDLQAQNGGSLAASGANDSGTTLKVARNSQFLGSNPYIDVRAYGVRAVTSAPSTRGSITSGTARFRLAAASTFQNGDGINISGAGATLALSTPSAPAVVASNTSGPTGTGMTVANASGATTYRYCVVALSFDGAATPCSPITSISNGAATLGLNTANVTWWTRTNNIVTITTAAPHNIVQGSIVSIGTDSAITGTWQVATVPDSTHFTFQTASDTRNGAPASGGSTGVVKYWTSNHVSWAAVTGAWKYLVFGRSGRSMVLLNVSLPEPAHAGLTLAADPLYNNFDDFGPTLTTAGSVPAWYPTTPPISGKNGDLVTTIVSGAGTTSLVLATNAGNTVSGATILFDNVPNIRTAATAAYSGAGAVLRFPATTTGAFYTTASPLTLVGFPNKLSVEQAGQISLGDTMILNNVTWNGTPKIPQATTAGGFESLVQIASVNANPMIYSTLPTTMSNVSLVDQSANSAVIWSDDKIGSIPGNQWSHVQFITGGGSDYMSRHLVIRNNISGGGGVFLDYVAFLSGQATGNSNTPLFIHTQNGGSPFSLKHIFLYYRGMFFGGGLQGTFDWIYEQGATMPKIFIANTLGGNMAVGLTITNSIEDTTQAPIVNYLGGLAGYINLNLSNGLAGFPEITGPGGVSVVCNGVGATGNSCGQTANSTLGVQSGTVIDGSLWTGAGSTFPYPVAKNNNAIAIGSAYKAFVTSNTQTAPTCSVSAGGTVPLASYTFDVAPVFSDGSEGPRSPISSICTATSGNQTITVNWAPVPGAIGYDLYKGGFAFQCAAPWVTGGATSSYVWSGAAGCGGYNTALPGGGPSYMTAAGLGAPQLKLSATNGAGTDSLVMPTATANRTQSFPDATGTFLLDNTLLLQPTLAAPAYDEFNRTNGAIGSNWTVTQGGLNVSSHAIVGTGSTDNSAFWNATTFSPDQFSQITIPTATTANKVFVRLSANGNGYACGPGGARVVLQKYTRGVSSNLTTASYTPVAGDTWRLEVFGTTFTCYRNGAVILTANNSSFATGQPGINTFDTSATADNWSGGNVHAIPRVDSEQDWTKNQHFSSITLGEARAAGGAASTDTLRADSLDHVLMQNLNNAGEQPLPQRAIVASAYTNATPTASNITGLSFTVSASRNYTAVCHLYYQGSANTAGLDITVTGPASPASVFYSYDEDTSVTGIRSSVASAFSTKLVGGLVIAATTNLHATVTIGLRNGANAGVVQVQASATGTGTVTVQAGSFCRVQ
jgi:hypothetical protein